ncbi:MAG: DUF1844 domain-containing protein [Planctomycetaceae bacterium]|nr:DUF1844 domain-containing protein [Planctomycetaceae bacterium]
MAENDKDKGGEEPKIIVDSDWKKQAQAEKEKLDKEVEESGAGGRGPRRIPPASFSTLVSSLAMQVMMSLGGMQDPQTKRPVVDLALAKHHIDTLAMLEEKTKGNITDEEKKLLDEALYQVRMQYVQIAQRVSQL